MSNKKMLIDATHPEETRVVVLSGNRLEDFDIEVAAKRQIKGNIYLAKITRVEPSLQAAFVDYGGNRHGFLAFSEIHPDYYQIPVSDREALIAEQEAAEKADEEKRTADEDAEAARAEGDENGNGAKVAEVGGDDSEEVESRRPLPAHRRYKIQEVIKRRQIMLVQVVKEERGNKGAALTTHLSLAGRYCVLMPNTARGGGISRKIATAKDRKRLKDILKDLNIPDGMAVIVRTAGSQRTKAEIKRDYEYLLRQWSQVREMTLESTAPMEVYEEGDIIKRAIRDMYNSDFDEVVVDGEEAYRQAKDFMKLLIPSHAKKVQPYKDDGMPMLRRYQVESQMDAMHGHDVQLRSGGYIVINPTEALVSIDVNSGKATRERNIEETALKTNMEAAEEVARQLRLRDLAGLVVIDFIDMERSRNNTQVERRLKDAMKQDRARIQIGRISPFGLMELSRQRLRPSLHETSFDPCPYCAGSGVRRSTDSTALYVLRAIEEECLKRKGGEMTVHVPTAVALYILNNKRPSVQDLEERYEIAITFKGDDDLIPPESRIERVGAQAGEAGRTEGSDDDGAKRKRRRRRRGRGGDENAAETQDDDAQAVETAEGDDDTDSTTETVEKAAEQGAGSDDNTTTEDGERKKRRRRGRRGGRRRRRTNEDQTETNETADEGAEASAAVTDDVSGDGDSNGGASTAVETTDAPDAEAEEKPKRRRSRAKKADADKSDPAETATDAATDTEEKPKRRRRSRKKPDTDTASEDVTAQAEAPQKDSEPQQQEAAANDVAAPEIQVEEVPKPVAEVEAPVTEAEAPEGETDEEGEARKAEAAKTTVIDLSEVAPEKKPTKRGWWSR